MTPGYKPTPHNLLPKRPEYFDDSILINRSHIKIFTNWINQRVYGRYNFRLLYRAAIVEMVIQPKHFTNV